MQISIVKKTKHKTVVTLEINHDLLISELEKLYEISHSKKYFIQLIHQSLLNKTYNKKVIELFLKGNYAELAQIVNLQSGTVINEIQRYGI